SLLIQRFPPWQIGDEGRITLAREGIELLVELLARDLERVLDGLLGRRLFRELLEQRDELVEAEALLDEQADESGLHVRDLDLVRIRRPDEAGIEIGDRQ